MGRILSVMIRNLTILSWYYCVHGCFFKDLIFQVKLFTMLSFNYTAKFICYTSHWDVIHIIHSVSWNLNGEIIQVQRNHYSTEYSLSHFLFCQNIMIMLILVLCITTILSLKKKKKNWKANDPKSEIYKML